MSHIKHYWKRFPLLKNEVVCVAFIFDVYGTYDKIYVYIDHVGVENRTMVW